MKYKKQGTTDVLNDENATSMLPMNYLEVEILKDEKDTTDVFRD